MSLLYFFIIIAFLIFIHELGHLLAAKWANVKVENFSIGFGPKIFKMSTGDILPSHNDVPAVILSPS